MNYKQLRYFWVIAKAGSISRASEILEITPQTLSGQISIFEADLGVTLFQRAGRGLELTEAGLLALPYAEDIFTTGNTLEENLRSNPNRHNRTFKVGVVDVVPKSIAYQLLSPAMHLSVPIKIICKEDKLEPLLGQLAIHKLDMVLSDQPIPDNVDIKSVNHSLGECAMSLFGTAALNAQYNADFPTSLQGAPMLMMSTESGIQKPLLRWFNHHHISTNVVGEFDDSALMKAFGQAGIGFFAGLTALSEEIERQYAVQKLADIPEIRQKFYAFYSATKAEHPAIKALNIAAGELMQQAIT